MRQLLHAGSNIQTLDAEGNSILHKAAFKGAVECGKSISHSVNSFNLQLQ